MSRSLRRRQQDHVDASMKMDGEEEMSLDPTFCLSKERCEAESNLECRVIGYIASHQTRRDASCASPSSLHASPPPILA